MPLPPSSRITHYHLTWSHPPPYLVLFTKSPHPTTTNRKISPKYVRKQSKTTNFYHNFFFFFSFSFLFLFSFLFSPRPFTSFLLLLQAVLTTSDWWTLPFENHHLDCLLFFCGSDGRKIDFFLELLHVVSFKQVSQARFHRTLSVCH